MSKLWACPSLVEIQRIEIKRRRRYDLQYFRHGFMSCQIPNNHECNAGSVITTNYTGIPCACSIMVDRYYTILRDNYRYTANIRGRAKVNNPWKDLPF